MRRIQVHFILVLVLACSLVAFADTPNPAAPASNSPVYDNTAPTMEHFSELDEAHALLVQDQTPWADSNVDIMNDLAPELTYDLINSSSLGTTDLGNYDFVVLAANQPSTFHTNVNNAMADLEDYVNGGGWLQAHFATNTSDPNMVLWDGTTYGNINTYDGQNWMGPDGAGHPILDGVAEPYEGNYASHGWMTTYPGDALILVEDSAGNPTCVEYEYGQGLVLCWTMPVEHAYFYDYSSGDILYNTMEYMLNRPPAGPVQIEINPVNGPIIIPPGSSFQFNVHVTSMYPQTVTAILWTEVELPNGQVFGPLASGQLSISNGMDWTSPNFTQNISFAAPEGQYRYYIYAGLNMQNPQLDDSFTFTVDAPAPDLAGGTGDWTLEGFDKLGQVASGEAETAVGLPAEFALMPVYPNPFNPTANVSVALPQTSDLTVSVFNVTGQRVATLASGQHSAGVHNFTLDGSGLSSGAYFVQATAGSETALQKVLLMK